MPHSHIAIIGAPLDLGQGRRGVDMGPSAMRVASLNARLAALGLRSDRPGQHSVEQAEAAARGRRSRQVSGADRRRLRACWASGCTGRLARGCVPLVLGGDHSVAVGTVSGVAQYLPRARRKHRPDLARRARRHEHARDPAPAATFTACRWLAWSGAGPARTDRTAGARGPRSSPRNTVIVGLRDVDQLEKPHVRETRRARLHHARHRRARHARGDGRSHPHRHRRHRRLPPFARHGFRRPRRRARRGHAGARRRHLPRSAFGHGNDLRFGKDDRPWKWWK